MENSDKHIFWAIVLSNSVCVICWTALAILFDKWWIALFAILFWSSGTVHRHYRYCDQCGKIGPYANSPDEALSKARGAGWLITDDGKDYCPKCREYRDMIDGFEARNYKR